MSVEIRIPISWRPDFINRCVLIHKAARRFDPDVRTRVTVGPDIQTSTLLPPEPVDGLDFVFMPAGSDAFWKGTAHEYISTMMERWKPPFTTDHVVMLDADVLPVSPFDELVTGDTLKACMAHVPPFGRALWTNLFHAYKTPWAVDHMDYALSGSGIMLDGRVLSPPYFNTGVVAAPAALLEALYEPYMDALGFVRGMMDSYFFEQIALTLALAKTRAPFEVLPLRYNFPNQDAFEWALPGESAAMHMLHFLRESSSVHRVRDFASADAMNAFAERKGLIGVNETLRQHVATLL